MKKAAVWIYRWQVVWIYRDIVFIPGSYQTWPVLQFKVWFENWKEIPFWMVCWCLRMVDTAQSNALVVFPQYRNCGSYIACVSKETYHIVVHIPVYPIFSELWLFFLISVSLKSSVKRILLSLHVCWFA